MPLSRERELKGRLSRCFRVATVACLVLCASVSGALGPRPGAILKALNEVTNADAAATAADADGGGLDFRAALLSSIAELTVETGGHTASTGTGIGAAACASDNGASAQAAPQEGGTGTGTRLTAITHVYAHPAPDVPAARGPNPRVVSAVPDLAALLHPATPEEYFGRHFETAPLHCHRNDRGYFEAAGTAAGFRELDAMFLMHRYVADVNPHLLAESAGGVACRFTKDGFAATLPVNIKYLVEEGTPWHAYINGATVVCDLVSAYYPAVGRLVQGLGASTSGVWSANLYATPPGQQGFTTHNDMNDGLIVQTGGEKTWAMYNSTASMPDDMLTRGRPHQLPAAAELGPAVYTGVLKAGDTLTVPRGLYHNASTGPATGSVHLTVTPLPSPGWVAWKHVLRAALDTVEKDARSQEARRLGGASCKRVLMDAIDLLVKESTGDGALLRASLSGPNYTDHGVMVRDIPLFRRGMRAAKDQAMRTLDNLVGESGGGKAQGVLEAWWRVFLELLDEDAVGLLRGCITDKRMRPVGYIEQASVAAGLDVEKCLAEMGAAPVTEATSVVRGRARAEVDASLGPHVTCTTHFGGHASGATEHTMYRQSVGDSAFSAGRRFEAAIRHVVTMQPGAQFRITDLPVVHPDPFERIALFRVLEEHGLAALAPDPDA